MGQSCVALFCSIYNIEVKSTPFSQYLQQIVSRYRIPEIVMYFHHVVQLLDSENCHPRYKSLFSKWFNHLNHVEKISFNFFLGRYRTMNSQKFGEEMLAIIFRMATIMSSGQFSWAAIERNSTSLPETTYFLMSFS